MSAPSFMIVRNITGRDDRLTLRLQVPPQLIRERVRIRVTLDASLIHAFRAGKGKLRGLQPDGKDGFLITGADVRLVGLLLATREQGNLRVELEPTKLPTQGDITITQIGSNGVQGGVTLRLKR